MSGTFRQEDLKPFDYEELHGKTLKVLANRSEEGLVVVGVDVATNVFYVLKAETNEEKRGNK